MNGFTRNELYIQLFTLKFNSDAQQIYTDKISENPLIICDHRFYSFTLSTYSPISGLRVIVSPFFTNNGTPI